MAAPQKGDSNVVEQEEALILVTQLVTNEKKVILFDLEGSKVEMWQPLPPRVFVGQNCQNQLSLEKSDQGDTQ